MMKGKKIFRQLTLNEACLVYERLLEGGYVSFPLTREARNKLEALISNVNSSYFGREIYATPEEKVVAYLYFIIKGHPFVDGNKRSASLLFEVVCALNDMNPRYNGFTLDELAVFIEEKESSQEYQEFIRALATILFDE